MENKHAVAIVAVVGVFGVVFAGSLGYRAGQESSGSPVMVSESEYAETLPMDHSAMTMDQMTEGLQGLSGDAFDKAFIEMMIVHHQGAVDMARLIPENAKHEELKKLGEDIITAQTKEIEMMEGWLKEWGYDESAPQKIDDGGMMMDHSGMGH